MAYVAEPARTTGELMTASIWNQAIKDNVAYVKAPPSRTISANATAVNTDRKIICTAALTLTLFGASGNDGEWLQVVNDSGANVTVARAGTDNIRSPNGSNVASVLVSPGQILNVYCNGTLFLVW